MSHNNALHNAAKEGNLSEVQILVRNFDINAKGQHGGTALYWAAREGHTEIVKLLLTLNADVNIPDVSVLIMTYVHLISRYSNTSNTSSSSTPIHFSPTVLPVQRCWCSLQNQEMTALTYAAHEGHNEVVLELMAHPAININHVMVSFTSNK